MSIIFQTLSRLHSTAEGDRPPQAHKSLRPKSAGAQAVGLKRSLRIGAVAAAALIVIGWAAIAGMTYLTGRLPRQADQTSGHPEVSAGANGSVVAAPTRPVPATRTTAQYLPPDSAFAQGRNAASHSPVPADADSGAHPPLTAGARQDSRQAVESPPEKSNDSQADIVRGASREKTPGSMETTGTLRLPPKSQFAVQAGNAVASDPLSAGQHEAQQALHAARAKNERITRLVDQIESALSGSSFEADHVEKLIEELEHLKQPDSPYLDKLRAYYLLREGKYDQARTILDQLAAVEDEDLDVGINLAVIDLRTGKVQAARQRLLQLKRAHPDDTRLNDLVRRLP